MLLSVKVSILLIRTFLSSVETGLSHLKFIKVKEYDPATMMPHKFKVVVARITTFPTRVQKVDLAFTLRNNFVQPATSK